MIAEFYHSLHKDGEDLDLYVQYKATRYFNEVDIELLSAALDGHEIVLSEAEYSEIILACFDRVDDDFIEEQDAYGDYMYERDR